MRYLRSLSIVAVAFAALVEASAPGPLESPADRAAFRRWFAFLAESRYYARKTAHATPDSSSLVRWVFQQSLIDHNPAWARSTELPVLPHMPSISQPVPGSPAFAAHHLVSRDIADALPGDILRFGNADVPASLMIYVGPSQIVPSPAHWVIYLAGPPREGQTLRVHRVNVETLLADPAPTWRPAPDNPEFLGVWRFDLLGADETATGAPAPNQPLPLPRP